MSIMMTRAGSALSMSAERAAAYFGKNRQGFYGVKTRSPVLSMAYTSMMMRAFTSH
jgi:hypothetical protein